MKALLGFEGKPDLAIWEVAKGPALELSTQHATEGKQALKVQTGNYLVTWKLPGDWRGYDSLDLDAFNDTGSVVRVSLFVGDQAWQAKGDGTYWNRHNGGFNLLPGANRVSIPVEGLYRGEAGSRNNDIPRNIDAGSIVRLDLGFTGQPGSVYLDHFRLVRGAKPAAVRAFDFGPESQTRWPGFAPVSWNTVYTRQRGYGLQQIQVDPNRARDDTFPTRLFSDWVSIDYGDFRVDVPPGRYRVWTVFNDCGYWGGEYARHTRRRIEAEGDTVVEEDRGERGGSWEPLHLFQDVEPLPGSDFGELYFDVLFRPREFEVDVTDGQLNLRFIADAPWSAKLAALVIYPVDQAPNRSEASGSGPAPNRDEVSGSGQAAGGAGWLQEVATANRREFLARAAPIPLPEPVGLEEIPESARRKGYLLFQPDEDETVFFTSVPRPAQLNVSLSQTAARGETVPLTFALRPLQEMGELRVQAGPLTSASGKIPAAAVQVRAVRHLAKRGFGNIRYRITPWYLSDFTVVKLPANLTRQFWVTVQVPAHAAPGRYEGTLQLSSSSGLRETLRLTVRVLPFMLAESDFPVCFYGMRPEWLTFMRGYGMTTVSGGPNVRFLGFDRRKRPQLDFAPVDAYMEALKDAGYRAELLSYGGPANLDGHNYENVPEVFAEWGKPAGLDALQAARRVFASIERHAKKKEWLLFVYALCDEPRVRETTERIIKSIRFLNRASPWLKTAGSYSVDFTEKEDPLLIQAMFRELDVSIVNNHDEAVMAEARKLGKEIYIYNQGRSRYTFGAYLWSERAKGVKGFCQWHMFATHGYQFFDLDGREPDAGIIVVRSDGIRPTLDLERVRRGAYDFRYFLTLEPLIARARAAGHVDAAAAAEQVLANITGRIRIGQRSRPDWLDVQVLRRWVVEQILRLTRLLG